jgi:hypothetical protein
VILERAGPITIQRSNDTIFGGNQESRRQQSEKKTGCCFAREQASYPFETNPLL